jgi:lipopolysaccharide cholinephosphotransferase
MRNIIIFGTGEFGNNIYKQYKKIYNILYFCDNDISKHGTYLFDIEVINPSQLDSIDYDTIYIASSYCEEIYSQLTQTLNIASNKITKLYVNESKIQFYFQDKREKSEYFMFDILKLLKLYNIVHYIDHGTLLGIVRDNSLILWDKDIDIAVFIEDKIKILDLLKTYLANYIHPNCQQNNWKYKIIEEEITTPNGIEILLIEIQIYNDSIYLEDEVALDLMFRYVQKETIYWGVCGKYLTVPIKITLPTTTLEFKGHLLNVPKDITQYLENLYGTWKIASKEWTYDKYNNI